MTTHEIAIYNDDRIPLLEWQAWWLTGIVFEPGKFSTRREIFLWALRTLSKLRPDEFPKDCPFDDTHLAEAFYHLIEVEFADRIKGCCHAKDRVTNEMIALRFRIDSLSAEVLEKTETLRSLRKEQDPERLSRLMAEARDAGRAEGAAEAARLREEIEALRREVGNLRASKKRLREALERSRRTP